MAKDTKYVLGVQRTFNRLGAHLSLTGKNDADTSAVIRGFQRSMGYRVTGTMTPETVMGLRAFHPASLSQTGSTASPMQDSQRVSGSMMLTPPMPNMRPRPVSSLPHPISQPMPGMTDVAKSVGQPGGFRPDMGEAGYYGGPPPAMQPLRPQDQAMMAQMSPGGQEAVMRGQQQQADRTQSGRDALAAAMAARAAPPAGPWARNTPPPTLSQPPPSPMQASMMPQAGSPSGMMAPPGGPPGGMPAPPPILPQMPPQGATGAPPMGPPPPRPMPNFAMAGPPPTPQPPQDQSQMVGLPGGQAYPSIGAMASDKLGGMAQMISAMIYGPQGPPPGAPPPSPEQIQAAKQKLASMLIQMQQQKSQQVAAQPGEAGY